MPHLIITTQIRIESGPTFVGDEQSDPDLMAQLEAVPFKEEGKTYFVYKTNLLPRLVLDRLEEIGYKIIGMVGIGQTCLWTLHKN